MHSKFQLKTKQPDRHSLIIQTNTTSYTTHKSHLKTC